MGDENLICTLGDYSKPSHEGYRNTIKLPVENNVEGAQKEWNQNPIKVVLPKISLLASLKELNKNLSASKRVHFVNLIVILSINSDTEEEEDISSTNAHEHELDNMVRRVKEVKEQGKEEDEIEIDEEVEEIFKEEEVDEDDENFNSFSTMKELSHHECIIDRHLGEMVFGRPFIDETGLIYNEEEGTVMFEEDDEKITFKMPHTMEILKKTKIMGVSTDSIPPSAYEENFGHERTQ
nr:hypothetical protein [Tanacetum cinerariifolium]